MTEKVWQREVVRVAREYGWRIYHTLHSVGATPGFPDLVLAHERLGVLFVELKSEKGKTTMAQDDWLATLRAGGARAEVWRPADAEHAWRTLAGLPAPPAL